MLWLTEPRSTMETIRSKYILLPMLAVILLILGTPIDALNESTNCTNVQCPPMSEFNCPADSNVREYQESSIVTTNTNHEIVKEVFIRCCMTQKCSCKTCDIPSCHNSSQVIYEIVPESQTPGKCCGEYICTDEPNCSEINDTDGVWLTDCQRCECIGGERICLRVCDEIMPHQMTIACKSNNLNRFFMHGETWVDDCYECECVNGKEKCILPFCKSVDCPHSQQVTLSGQCCPICVPAIDTNTENSTEIPIIENTSVIKQLTSFTPTSPTTTTTTTTPSPTTPSTTTQIPPCVTNEPPVTYAIYTEVVEVVSPERFSTNFQHIIIVILFLLLVVSVICNVNLWRKQRYYSVCSVDDNDSAKLKNIVYA